MNNFREYSLNVTSDIYKDAVAVDKGILHCPQDYRTPIYLTHSVTLKSKNDVSMPA